MKKRVMVLGVGCLVLSSLACSLPIPNIQISTVSPVLDVGPMETYDEEIPLEETEAAEVNVRFGAGEIDLQAGEPDPFFSGQFRTNVAEWAPEVTWQNDVLTIQQGEFDAVEGIGIPESDDAENEWELTFSPDVEMEMDIAIGAADGDMDFSGLALSDLSLDVGASELRIRFDEPNLTEMDDLSIQVGAGDLRVDGIGNASPHRMSVRGGAGNLELDFRGEWVESARVEVEAGVGNLVLRFPEGIGVQVEVSGGFGNVDADSAFDRSGKVYANEAYGEAEIELVVEVTMGVGNVELELMGE